MSHADTPGRRRGRHAECHAARRDEPHAAHRRPARAAGDLHGGAAADPEGDRQPAAVADADARSSRPPSEQIVLEYAADGAIAVNHQRIALDQLEARLRTIYADRRDKTLFISGAPSLRYKAIIGAIDAAKGAGVDRVGIITEGMRKARRQTTGSERQRRAGRRRSGASRPRAAWPSGGGPSGGFRRGHRSAADPAAALPACGRLRSCRRLPPLCAWSARPPAPARTRYLNTRPCPSVVERASLYTPPPSCEKSATIEERKGADRDGEERHREERCRRRGGDEDVDPHRQRHERRQRIQPHAERLGDVGAVAPQQDDGGALPDELQQDLHLDQPAHQLAEREEAERQRDRRRSSAATRAGNASSGAAARRRGRTGRRAPRRTGCASSRESPRRATTR